MRAETRALIAAMAPGDPAEAADLRYALDWIDSGARIWREGGPADSPGAPGRVHRAGGLRP